MKVKQKDKFERMVREETLIFDATEEICRILDERGLRRKDLAELLGVTKARVTHLLSGKRNITLRTLAVMAYALDHRVEIALIPMDGEHDG